MVKPAPALRSRLVNALVIHERLRKRETHRFTNRVFYGLIDVDEIPQLDENLWTFSAQGRSLYSLGTRDFVNYGQPDIKGNIKGWLKDHGYDVQVERVTVFAHLRTLGVNFNPISVFFVETPDETLCLAEVDNTFGEAKLYYLGPLGKDGHLMKRIPKDYYVSPFIEHDADFVFDIKRNDDTLKVQVTTVKGKEPILFASMQGDLHPVSDWNLLGYLFRMPLTPIRVMGAIHWHALRLMIKRIPYLKKEENPEQQRDYYVHKDHKRHIT
jgi:uncharacterized protein